MKWLPRISFDHKDNKLPDPALAAALQLNEARMDKLKAERELEYWAVMVQMLNIRIQRLASLAGCETL